MINKQKIKKCVIILIFVIILSLSCFFYSKINPFVIKIFASEFNIVSSKNKLLVHFINVGQADAIAVNLPDGKIFLIDTGCEEVNVTYTNYLKENVLNSKRSNYIDYLVLSHADMDHVGGTLKLLKNFDVGTIFMPKVASASAGYDKIYDYVVDNCNYQVLGDEFIIGNDVYNIKFFRQLSDADTNDASQVVKLEYGDDSFLFTGDISSSVEEKYINLYGRELDSDVLKISHHGSKTSTSAKFLEIVTPEYAVISVGNNSYGHPTGEVLNRLIASETLILRTDEKGDVLFISESCGLNVLTDRFYVTKISLDYRYFVLIVDGVMLIWGVAIILKKEKNKHL